MQQAERYPALGPGHQLGEDERRREQGDDENVEVSRQGDEELVVDGQDDEQGQEGEPDPNELAEVVAGAEVREVPTGDERQGLARAARAREPPA